MHPVQKRTAMTIRENSRLKLAHESYINETCIYISNLGKKANKRKDWNKEKRQKIRTRNDNSLDLSTFKLYY